MGSFDAEFYFPSGAGESEVNRRGSVLGKVRQEVNNAGKRFGFLEEMLLRSDFDVELVEGYR